VQQRFQSFAKEAVMRMLRASLGITALVLMSACGGLSTTEKGTIAGAAIGGVAGHALTGGSAIGTIGGAAAGGIIGHEIGEDRQRRGR
jgi:osmotically inducible lipoprotein OsmB